MHKVKIPDLSETVHTLGWAFWLAWVLASSVGWIVGLSMAWLLSEFISPLMPGGWKAVFWAVGGMVVGINFGVNQWFLIRPVRRGALGRRANWWVLATVLGWAISLAVVIGMGVGARIGYTFSGLIIGFAVGIPQSLMLSSNDKRGWLWVAVQSIAWMAGLSAVSIPDKAVGFAAVGVISGAISGGALIWLLGQPPQESEPDRPITG